MQLGAVRYLWAADELRQQNEESKYPITVPWSTSELPQVLGNEPQARAFAELSN